MSRAITYCQALNEGMRQEMARDGSVFVYGIDVADHKRTFNSHAGLVEDFGAGRCFSTPLSEDAMTGFGLGAAMNGLRPIHVHMRVDFFLLCMNQLANMVASQRYASGGRLGAPMVIRAIIGRGWGQSFQHSKTLQSWFAHVPGLKVVMPSTPRDAKGMLASAVRDDDPVVIIEHRWLYDAVGEVPEGDFTAPLTGAQVLREGGDITFLATSWMNVEALQAAEILQRRHGVSATVIDARSITGFDAETVCASVARTRRLLVADNDWTYCGFSAEVAAQVYDRLHGQLKGPIRRIGFEATHCPCTRPLENVFYQNAVQIIRSVERDLGLPEADLSGEPFYSYEHKFRGPF
jgi:pyruvate dehydrogenase E1 component beta subunit